jgi:hypothetical protein
MKRLLDTRELALALGRPIRQIRSLIHSRKISYMRVGHRSLLFDLEKVERELGRFEVPAIGDKK